MRKSYLDSLLDSWVFHWMLPCLSVLDSGRVKHYKLKKLENGHYFVSRSRSFQTLNELVEYYSKQADGLCVRLGEPCKKVKHEPNTSCLLPESHCCLVSSQCALFYTAWGPIVRSVNRDSSLCVDGGSTDSWSVLQHCGPMGDWPQVHQAAEEAGSRSVWRSVRGPVERDHSSGSEDPQTWYFNAFCSLTKGVKPETNDLGMSENWSYQQYSMWSVKSDNTFSILTSTVWSLCWV